MKSKILKHFVDVFCKKFLGYCIFYSARKISVNGSGKYKFDFLNNEYLFEDKPQKGLKVALEIQGWFDEMIEKNNFIRDDFNIAELIVESKAPAKYKIPSHTTFKLNCNALIEYRGKQYKCTQVETISDITLVDSGA